MAKRNNRNILKRPDSSLASMNLPSCSSDHGNVSVTFSEINAHKDSELIPYCFSSFCYLGLFIWLLLDKNYNRLVDRNSLVVIATCYTIEFAKFVCHLYLVGKMTANHMWLKTNPILWVFQFVAYTALGVAMAYITSILFGAPLTSKQEQTFVFSLLLTAVLITPNTFQIGSNILPLLLTNCVETEVFGPVDEYEKNNFRATILGAFVGTAVIPFDWETEWQRWPIPCSVGLIGGHLAANVYKIICWQFKSLNKYSINKYKI